MTKISKLMFDTIEELNKTSRLLEIKIEKTNKNLESLLKILIKNEDDKN